MIIIRHVPSHDSGLLIRTPSHVPSLEVNIITDCALRRIVRPPSLEPTVEESPLVGMCDARFGEGEPPRPRQHIAIPRPFKQDCSPRRRRLHLLSTAMTHVILHGSPVRALSAKIVWTDDGRIALLAVGHEAAFVPALLGGRVGCPLAVFVALAEVAGVRIAGGPRHGAVAVGEVAACGSAVGHRAMIDVAVLEVEGP
jgi:hypothetical protein